MFRVDVAPLQELKNLSTPFWEFPILFLLKNLKAVLPSVSFYSLLGVSEFTEFEKLIPPQEEVAFYSLLGVSG